MHQPRALRALLLVAAFAAALASPAAGPATAADDGNTSFAPADNTATNPHAFFELRVNPGVRVRDRVVLENRSDQPQTYDIYPADATSVGGGFALSPADAQKTDVGNWLKVPVRTVVLQPSQSRTFGFVLTVPANATPGDHAGGIVALPRTTQAVDGSGNIQLQARYGVGVRFYVTVNGALRPRLSLTKLSLHLEGGFKGSIHAGSATVSYQVANSGNVRLTPQSTGKLMTRTRSFPLKTHQFGEMLPGSKPVVVTEKVKGLGWGSLIGRVHAKVTVSAPGARPVTKEVTAWRTPWLSLIGAGGVIALMAGAGVIGLRRRTTPGLEPTAEEPERVPV